MTLTQQAIVIMIGEVLCGIWNPFEIGHKRPIKKIYNMEYSCSVQHSAMNSNLISQAIVLDCIQLLIHF